MSLNQYGSEALPRNQNDIQNCSSQLSPCITPIYCFHIVLDKSVTWPGTVSGASMFTLSDSNMTSTVREQTNNSIVFPLMTSFHFNNRSVFLDYLICNQILKSNRKSRDE